MSIHDVENALVQLEHDPTVQRALLLDERIPYDLRRGGMMEYLSHTNLDTVDDKGGTAAMQAFVKSDGKTGFSKFAGRHMYHNGDFTPKPKKRRDGNWWERLHKNDEIEYSDTDRRAMKEAGDKAKKDAMFAAREEMSTLGLPPAEVSKKCEEIGLQAKEDAERAALDALKAKGIAKAKSKARWRMLRLVFMPAMRMVVTQRLKYTRMHTMLIKEAIMNGVQFNKESESGSRSESESSVEEIIIEGGPEEGAGGQEHQRWYKTQQEGEEEEEEGEGEEEGLCDYR
jgi:hypothetical protein